MNHIYPNKKKKKRKKGRDIALPKNNDRKGFEESPVGIWESST